MHAMAPLAAWMRTRYPGARRFVEVGVGRRPDVALDLAASVPTAEVVVTDTDPDALAALAAALRPVRDDVRQPDLSHYRGAALVYSLHPPEGILGALESVADAVGADLLVVPASAEAARLTHWRWVPFMVQGHVAWMRRPDSRAAGSAAAGSGTPRATIPASPNPEGTAATSTEPAAAARGR